MGSRSSRQAGPSAHNSSLRSSTQSSEHSSTSCCGFRRKRKSSPPVTPPPSPPGGNPNPTAHSSAIRTNRVESSAAMESTRRISDMNITDMGPGGDSRRGDAAGQRHHRASGSGRRFGGGGDERSRQHSGSRGHGGVEGDRPYVQMSCRVTVEELILDTLRLIRTLVDNQQETPRSMMRINQIAEGDKGWVEVVSKLIQVIPSTDPLGPAAITLLLDECPLPTKEAVADLYTRLDLAPQTSKRPADMPVNVQRNICMALGCLAEKMAGASSVWLLTPEVLRYLLDNLSAEVDSSITLFSVIALEKFAQTSENKESILRELRLHNALEILERGAGARESGADTAAHGTAGDFVRAQIRFCAQWCLDNLFVLEDRVYSYKSMDLGDISVMLNSQDVSEYLKISPDGLQARCDAASFESVRCTFQVDAGVWYYEALIITAGVMQIGWATKHSKFLNYEGYGIGDDEHSLSYDGCRQLIWFNAKSSRHEHPCWQPGDVLGLLLDADNGQVTFSLNGRSLAPLTQLFSASSSGFFAAASFMSFQQCHFNFGSRPFRHPPPNVQFQRFNDFGQLTSDEKVILPRPVKLALLRQTPVREDSCSLCVDNKACVTLLPCGHRGFCMTCALQLEICPMCREAIAQRQEQH